VATGQSASGNDRQVARVAKRWQDSRAPTGAHKPSHIQNTTVQRLRESVRHRDGFFKLVYSFSRLVTHHLLSVVMVLLQELVRGQVSQVLLRAT
jgi:hypothetical protein